MFTQDPTLDEIYFNGNHAIGMLHGMTTTTHPCPVIEAQDWLRQLQEFSMSQHHLLTPRQPSAGGFLHNHDLRWQAAIPPLAPPSGMLILRKHRFAQLNLADFALDRTHQEQIRTALERKQPLLIFGSTGVGKTSLLATILKYWAPVERTFVLENLQEFPLLHPLYARLQPGPQYDYKATLQTLVRCRPERIIFGELPPDQAEIFSHAIHLGLQSPCATLHAGNLDHLARRLGGSTSPSAVSMLTIGMQTCFPPRVATIDPLYLNNF